MRRGFTNPGGGTKKVAREERGEEVLSVVWGDIGEGDFAKPLLIPPACRTVSQLGHFSRFNLHRPTSEYLD